MTDPKTQEQLNTLHHEIDTLAADYRGLGKAIPPHLGDRLDKLENPPAPSPEKLKKLLENAGIPSGWLDSHANISDQTLYASSQVVNFNPSAATFAPEALTVNAAGLSVAGVQVFDFFNSEKFRNSIRGILHLSQDLPVQETLRAHAEKIGANAEKLLDHSRRITGLGTEVAKLAGIEARQAQRTANMAEGRAAAMAGRHGSRRAADGQRAEAQHFSSEAEDLRAIRDEVQRLATALD